MKNHLPVVYHSAVMFLAALITSRLDTCISSVAATTRVRYRSRWNEVLIAYSVVALRVAAFTVTAKRRPVFSEAGYE